MDLKGKKALVTGGSSGIGKATAIELVKEGALVVITGRNKEKLERTAQEIMATPLHFDVSDYECIEEKTAEAIASMGGIDILINNAGVGDFDLLEDVNVKQFENVFSTNVFGLAMLTQEVSKYFKAQQRGDIINIASTAATKGFAHGTVYSASKFALRGMTQCWQAELRKHNIRVMLINPSEVTTAFNKPDRIERDVEPSKLRPAEISHMIVSSLKMNAVGFIPELTVWATNPQ